MKVVAVPPVLCQVAPLSVVYSIRTRVPPRSIPVVTFTVIVFAAPVALSSTGGIGASIGAALFALDAGELPTPLTERMRTA